MDIAADLGAAIKRLEDLAKNIFENGAPHQKEHAADLAAAVAAVKGGTTLVPAVSDGAVEAKLADAEAQLAIAKDSLTAEMDKTDTANAMVKTLQGQLTDAEATIVERESTIATLTAELAAATAPPASEDAAQKS